MSDFYQPWPCFDNSAVFLCCWIFSGINTPGFATGASKRMVLFKPSSETQFKAAQHLRCKELSVRGGCRMFNKAAGANLPVTYLCDNL